MKYIALTILTLIPCLSFSQETKKSYSEIFKTVFCKPYSGKKEKVFYVNAVGIDKYEFYQDNQSLDETYRLINSKSDNQIDLSISHNILINHYDKVPYKVISTFIRIDTTEINKSLSRLKDYRGDQVIWDKIVDNCDAIKFIKRFRPKVIRTLFKYECLFVSCPVLFSDNKYAIIKSVNIRFGSKINDVYTKIYFLEFSKNSWTIKDIFTVIDTSTLTNDSHLKN